MSTPEAAPHLSRRERRAQLRQAVKPKTVDELTHRNVSMMLEREKLAKANHSAGEKLATHVAAFCGSMPFIWIHIVWFVLWVAFNMSSLVAHPFDPFPFPFLIFIVSLEAIFLSAFILISQNHETRLSEQRSHLDVQINLLIEQENTQMLKILRSIASKLKADFQEDPDLAVLEQAMRPENILDQIDKASAGDAKPQVI
jgi:uncharacterized membrane protein